MDGDAPAYQDSVGIVEIFRILRRHLFLIFSVVFIITLAAIAVVAAMKDVYVATADVTIERNYGEEDEIFIATQMELLHSRALAKAVVDRLGLGDDPEFASVVAPRIEERLEQALRGETSASGRSSLTQEEMSAALSRAEPTPAADHLLDRIDIIRAEESRALSVAAASSDPQKAALIANEWVRTYVQVSLNEAREQRRQRLEILSEQMNLAKQRLTEAEAAVSAFMRDNDLVSFTPSPVLEQIRHEEAELSTRLAELKAYYGPNYPEVLSAEARLAELRSLMAEEAAVSNLQAGATTEIHALGQEPGDTAAIEATTELRALQEKVIVQRDLYVALLTRLQNESSPVEPEYIPVRVVSYAPIPEEADRPKRKRIVAVAFAGALALAIIFVLVAEGADNRVRTAAQSERLLGVSTMAMVPLVRRRRNKPIESLVQDKPHCAFSVSLRSLYIDILSRKTEEGPCVVVVTSPFADEGKSTIARALEATAIANDSSAVVVDLDERAPPKPKQSMRGAKGRAAGPDVEKLPTIPNRMTSPTRLPKLIDELGRRFEMIIFDAPPILESRDAKVLATVADASVLVLEWGETPPDAARAAGNLLGERLTGVVLNRVDYNQHARRGYGDEIQFFSRSAKIYRDI